MLPTLGIIECYRGDGLARTIAVTDADGAAKDISDWTIRFTAKVKDTDADADAVITAEATIVDGAAGSALLSVTGAETDIAPGTYVCDLEFTPLAGQPMTAKGLLRIVQDVRRGA